MSAVLPLWAAVDLGIQDLCIGQPERRWANPSFPLAGD